MPVGVAVTSFPTDDPNDGRLVAANRAASKNVGLDLSEFIGKPFRVLSVDDVSTEIENSESNRMSYEVAVSGNSRTFASYELTSGPARGRYEASIFKIGDRQAATVFRRIDAEVEANSALNWAMYSMEMSNVRLSQFASTVAHDLKNPLAGIGGNAEILEMMRADMPDQTAEIVSRIRELSALATEMIDGTLDFARSSGRETAAASERVDLSSDVIGWVLSMLEEDLRAASAEVIIGELPPVLGHSAALRQVFQNLFTNALRYRSKDRPCVIELTHKPRGDGVCLVLSDNGVGIAEKDRESVFDWGFQSEDSPSTTGHGLGLAACRTVLRSLGADIAIGTANRASGTVVEMRFLSP